MAYSASDLTAEVRRTIADRADDGLLTSRGWLVASILLAHPLYGGSRERKNKTEDQQATHDFNVCMRGIAVSTAVDTALAQLKHQEEGRGDPDKSDPAFDMPVLPGFKHLRRVYPVRRDGAIFLVPLDQLSDEEIDAKCQTYRKSAIAYNDHADELERYGRSRSRSSAA